MPLALALRAYAWLHGTLVCVTQSVKSSRVTSFVRVELLGLAAISRLDLLRGGILGQSQDLERGHLRTNGAK